MAKLEDTMRVTTADFALWIENLDAAIPPDELQARLLKEIEGLSFGGEPSFFKGKVHHIEVSRFCKQEVSGAHSTLQQRRALGHGCHPSVATATRHLLPLQVAATTALLQLEERVNELNEKRKYRAARSKSTAAEERALREAVSTFNDLNAELHRLALEADSSTGHAFVVFNEEVDRNRFYVLFHPHKVRASAGWLGAPPSCHIVRM